MSCCLSALWLVHAPGVGRLFGQKPTATSPTEAQGPNLQQLEAVHAWAIFLERKSGGSEACSRTIGRHGCQTPRKSAEKWRKWSGVWMPAPHTPTLCSGSQWLENSVTGRVALGICFPLGSRLGEKLQSSFSKFDLFSYLAAIFPLPSSSARSCFFQPTAAHIPARHSQCWPFELSPALFTGRPCVQLPALLRRGPST